MMDAPKDDTHTGLGPQGGKISDNADDVNLSILNERKKKALLHQEKPDGDAVPRKSSFSGNE